MLEKIQYALILLLFVLTGSLECTSFQNDAESVQPALSRSTVVDPLSTVRDYAFSAICFCEASVIESSGSYSDHKAILRHHADTRIAAKAAYDLHSTMRTRSRVLPADAVDYYIFSLGRIRI